MRVTSCSSSVIPQRVHHQKWRDRHWNPSVWLPWKPCWYLQGSRRKGYQKETRWLFSSRWKLVTVLSAISYYLIRLWGKLRYQEQRSLEQPLLSLICWFCSYKGEFLVTSGHFKWTDLTKCLFLNRTRLFQRNSLLVAPCRHISAALVLGLMIPVSFSLFPQLGTVRLRVLGAADVKLSWWWIPLTLTSLYR